MSPRTRRRMLAGLGGLLPLAGCTDAVPDGSDDPPPTNDETRAASETADAATNTGAPAETTDSSLDLREANVMTVEWVGAAGGDIDFSVTLYHDDDGEDGYANWWQIETLDGERLGRRDLTHAHGTREFTRSGTYAVPADVDCVVVRGHDQTHGYGGRAVAVTLADGATRGLQQGEDRQPVSAADCP